MRTARTGGSLNDEVDMLELCRELWKRKATILAFVVLSLLGGLAYFCLAKPVYESKVLLIPPSQNDVVNFNYGRTAESGLEPYSVKEVYELFLRNLQAESLRRAFFLEFYLPSLSPGERSGSQTRLYEDFTRVLVVSPVGGDSLSRYSVTVRGDTPEQVASWAEAYIRRSGESAKQEMIANVMREAEVRARNISQEIARLRESSQKVKEDLIVQLREALSVAKAIGLKEPPLIGGALSAEVSAGMDGHLTYMRGSRALEAEIEILESRKSEDPFIAKLRQLQTKYAFFMAVEVNPETVTTYRIDGPVELPDRPLKPRAPMVFSFSAVIGLLLGVAYVLLAQLIGQGKSGG